MGGERAASAARSGNFCGSPPRGRGTPRSPLPTSAGLRIIPAWAGNAQSTEADMPKAPDHPRVGGERLIEREDVHKAPGSSPRGRGTPAERNQNMNPKRIIPAWAGNAQPIRRCRSNTADHPRVGGERSTWTAGTFRRPGSSPRGRGTRYRRLCSGRCPRIIPAWAGNAIGNLRMAWCPTDHPRVGGERMSRPLSTSPGDGSSPRGRGTPPASV